jgi:hypothetical protein
MRLPLCSETSIFLFMPGNSATGEVVLSSHVEWSPTAEQVRSLRELGQCTVEKAVNFVP